MPHFASTDNLCYPLRSTLDRARHPPLFSTPNHPVEKPVDNASDAVDKEQSWSGSPLLSFDSSPSRGTYNVGR